MFNESGLINQPTPEAIVPQVVLTPPPAAGDTPNKVPTAQFNGNRSRNKEKGMAPAAPTEHAGAKPIVIGSLANSGSAKVVTLPTPTSSSSESASGKGSSDDGSEFTSEVEAQLAERIGKLWYSHRKKSSAVKQSSEELKHLRYSLAEQLHAFKALLVGTGRDGGWAPFLRDRGIPVTTADRYVKRHEASLVPVGKKLVADQLPPTAAEVTLKVKKLAPGLIRYLRGLARGTQFIQELEALFQVSFSASSQ
jgi:hypothetical protein